ncbi:MULTISPECIES: STAS domain-containing protein [Nocardia]|uniref:STAS domain-containing protein n=2 Tax=Nocardia TaxID=1817 RepID=A0A2T2YXZ9_9NOCA|nr:MULTISPECIES: STAS domain-containing protein [Nocardia]MBF6447251.1 STAS domain-containing protein [Nocardia elegans]PSR60402.1 STAS domain-containing protein [Nocardia nova]
MSSSAELRPVAPAGEPGTSQVAEARLTAVVRTRGPALVLSFRGEADSYTMPGWSERIRSAAESGVRIVVIDTSCLGFLSWRALLALAREAEHYRAAGVHLCLVTQSSTIMRIAALDSLTRQLPIHSTVVSAVSRAMYDAAGSTIAATPG